MKTNELKEKYQALFEELRPILTKSLSDLFQRPIMIQEQVEETTNIASAVGEANFPQIALMFQSGEGEHPINHLILLPHPFILFAYAWMTGEEPAQEVDENHLDGLREIFNQILGQIRMAIPDDRSRFHVENLQAGLAESAADVFEGNEPFVGTVVKAVVDAEDQQFELQHFAWSANWKINDEAEAMEEQSVDMNAVEHISVEPAEFGSLGGNGEAYENTRNIEMLLDVDLEIAVELDRKSMMVSELLKLGKGSIIEFQKSAGEPLDILVNGRKFAEGEVVVIDDKFGIRITQLISPKERLKTLG